MLVTEFKFKPSRQYLALLIFVFAVSEMIIAALSIAWSLKILFMIIAFSYGVLVIWRDALLLGKRSILQISYQADKTWLIKTNSQTYTASLLGDSTITKLASVLRFKVASNQSYSCVVFGDSLMGDQYRQLRVLLSGL